MRKGMIAMVVITAAVFYYGCGAVTPMVEKTIPSGTTMNVELLDSVGSATSSPGDSVQGRVKQDVVLDGKVVIPAGSTVSGSVTAARGLKKIGGKAILGVTFNSVELPSGETPIRAAFYREGKSETKKDAATIGGAAAGGAILGRILSRDHDAKGTAAGAIIGGAAGTAIAAGTKGEEIHLPSGTQLALHLQAPVTVKVAA
jgi:hypothetical protein